MGVSMDGSSYSTGYGTGTDFVVSPNGFVSIIPDGSVGPIGTTGSGMQYYGGHGGKGLHEDTYRVRIMDANWNQGARTSYENDRGQKTNPHTRQTISDSHPLAHFYHNQSYTKTGFP